MSIPRSKQHDIKFALLYVFSESPFSTFSKRQRHFRIFLVHNNFSNLMFTPGSIYNKNKLHQFKFTIICEILRFYITLTKQVSQHTIQDFSCFGIRRKNTKVYLCSIKTRLYAFVKSGRKICFTIKI